jgi:hypothetical protein
MGGYHSDSATSAFALALAFLSVIPEGNLLFACTTQKMGARSPP